ncbi:ABC transporter ATP-binding protein [Lichenifustis flavocetrariae]|uniref:Spermidine/putrescine import ATP-binding protein PotA n=1 Tax=Lichenifustis flavocetrariae TaxID=2949735 RepID=A0AA41Z3I3_9HYPH|nr:ABC transporter ATP-binding protein [Lichenifustis flavocetrariae]MCW6512341.1 ABC transporter ATP-binding protein [Lichenifustis flavocetrariae]
MNAPHTLPAPPKPGSPEAIADATSFVRFERVRKSYDGIHFVVEDLNLAVRKGEFLTMLGPSGSGKTTSLMMLGGFEEPTFGHIFLGDEPVERLAPEKRNIGFVFQSYALFPHMTVAENVAFPLRYRGIKGTAAADKVAKALGMVHLGHLAARKPCQMSGGQQQRVALARALVFDPTLVLMDEPLGALDKQLREHMQVEIKQLQRMLGITMVYVTHDQSEALTMSDRIAVFNDGRVQQLAAPEMLYEQPANSFVAGFIGENNLMPATVDATEGGIATLTMGDGSRLQAPNPAGVAVGAKARLAIRPERFFIQVGDARGPLNILRGPITDMFYLGDHVRLSVAVGGDKPVVARIPVSQRRPFARGETVTLGCAVTDCRLLEG